MEEIEKIKHERRFDVLKQLQNDKTLIKIKVPGKQYEHLTIVTGTHVKKNTPFFLIDFPEGFKEVVSDSDNCKIHFEFIGNDKIIYNFKTTETEVIRNELYIKFPETIHRLQRRNDFRVAPPLGTRLLVKTSSAHYEITVLNISRNGVLVSFGTIHEKSQPFSAFSVGSKLKNITLALPVEAQIQNIHLIEARVIRRDKNPLTNIDTCALHFTDIEKSQRKALIRLLYKFQRDLLQKKMSSLQ